MFKYCNLKNILNLPYYPIMNAIIGILLVVVFPALVLFGDSIWMGDWQDTQIVSIIISTFGLLFSLFLLNFLTILPGQKSLFFIPPVLAGVVFVIATIVFLFRLPYSIYYLIMSGSLGLVFCFLSQHFSLNFEKKSIAYVPVGRCSELNDIVLKGVRWCRLEDDFSYDDLSKCVAVVADFSDDNLSNDWQASLAKISLWGIPVYNFLQIQESLTGRIPIKHLHENNLGSLLPSKIYSSIKRLLDVVMVLITTPLVLPICLLVALIIKIESCYTGGSVFFTQIRVGQGGKMFRMYKFRSMIPTSELSGAKMAQIGDLRITRFGHFIRKTRLDELPQFINVLKGDMSLIGPRPEQPNFVEQFNNQIPFYCYRHIVKPGISGWAQVMQGYAGSEDETRIKLEYDFYYIKNFSFTLDVLIVIKTIQTMLTGFGAR